MEEKANTTETILALRPGRREMGIAVLEGRDLVFWGTFGFRAHSGQRLLTAVEGRLQDLVHTYQPAVLAIEDPTSARLAASPMLRAITDQTRRIAKGKGCPFRAFRPDAIRKQLCGSTKATRVQMVDYIVNQYPHLARYRKESSRWQKEYWTPMFTAVAVALVYARSPFSAAGIAVAG